MWAKAKNSNMDFKVMFPFLVISVFFAFDLQNPQRVLWLCVAVHMRAAGGRAAPPLTKPAVSIFGTAQPGES